MTVATMEPETTNEAAAPDEAEGNLLVYSEEYRCPRCDSAIPKECVKGTAKQNDRTFKLVRSILVYCPCCAAAFEADFITRDGRLHKASITRLVMDSRAKELALRLPNVFPHEEPEAPDLEDVIEQAKAGDDAVLLAGAIERTQALVDEMRAEYARRFPDRPLSVEEKVGIDQAGADCDLAESRLAAYREAHEPPAAALGGVPTPMRRSGVVGPACDVPPERSIDRSTSQEEPERFDGLA